MLGIVIAKSSYNLYNDVRKRSRVSRGRLDYRLPLQCYVTKLYNDTSMTEKLGQIASVCYFSLEIRLPDILADSKKGACLFDSQRGLFIIFSQMHFMLFF